MIYLRELTGASVIIGPFVDSTDGFTAETALVLSNGTIRLAKNGGAFAAKSAADSAVHKENGYYGFNVNTVDTNTPGALILCAVTSGALPVWFEVMVLASPIYDALVLGTDRLQVDVQEMAANVITATVIADNAIDAGAIATDAITAAKIAADAIGASELAADAVAEIADAIWDEAQSGHTGAGSFGKYVDSQLSVIAAYIDTEVAAIKAKTDQLTFTVANQIDANTLKVGGTTQTARDLGASVLLSPGTGTGQLDITSGVVKANLAQILGTALTETAGLIAAGFKKFFNVATPTGTVNSLPDAVAGAASGVAIVGSNMGAVTSVSGNVTGSVGSLATQAKADVNAEVVDALATDTNVELAALPGASPTIQQILLFLYEIARNKLTTTSTEQKIYKDNGTSVLGTWNVSDDGATFTKGEIA